MRYFFSPSENGFLDGNLRIVYEQAGTWPEDCIEIDDEIFFEFTSVAPENKMRIAGPDGLPAWCDIPEPSREELIAMAGQRKGLLRSGADAIITPLQDAVDMDMATEDEIAALTAWKKYRVLLNRIDTSAAPDIEWPKQPEK